MRTTRSLDLAPQSRSGARAYLLCPRGDRLHALLGLHNLPYQLGHLALVLRTQVAQRAVRVAAPRLLLSPRTLMLHLLGVLANLSRSVRLSGRAARESSTSILLCTDAARAWQGTSPPQAAAVLLIHARLAGR